VDTPGHVDFRAEVLSSYRSTDSALLLVDASQGVQGLFHPAMLKYRISNCRVAQTGTLYMPLRAHCQISN